MNKKRRRVDASVTVEASFIIPIIFFVILALICLCIFLYDKARLQTDMILGLEYAREQEELYGQISHRDVEEYVDRRMQTGYLSCKAPDIRVSVTGDLVTISAELVMQIPDDGFVGMLTGRFRKMKLVLQTDIANKEKILRVITGIARLADNNAK